MLLQRLAVDLGCLSYLQRWYMYKWQGFGFPPHPRSILARAKHLRQAASVSNKDLEEPRFHWEAASQVQVWLFLTLILDVASFSLRSHGFCVSRSWCQPFWANDDYQMWPATARRRLRTTSQRFATRHSPQLPLTRRPHQQKPRSQQLGRYLLTPYQSLTGETVKPSD